MAYIGDTVRLQVNFKSFEGFLIDPSDISLKIYDNAKNEVDSVQITEENKIATGQYFYDYVVPDDIHEYFIFEFRGLHNEKPILARGKVDIKFN